MKITYGALVMDIKDKDINDRLSILDRDGNQEITVADFPNEVLFRRHVSYALLYPDGNPETEAQIEGIQEFFEIYNEVAKLHNLVVGMEKGSTHPKSKENEKVSTITSYFKAQDWAAIRPHLLRGGIFSPSLLVALNRDLYAAYYKLARGGRDIPREIVFKEISGLCNVSYDRTKVPSVLSPFVSETTKRFNGAMIWLSKYDRFACDGACSEPSTLDFKPPPYFNMHEAIANQVLECSAGGGCFTGETYLKTVEGGLITFDALAKLNAQGQPLPQLASFNEATEAIVFQQPTRLIDHGIMQSTLVYLRAQKNGGETVTLKVTSEHRLFVERNGAKVWVPVGDLKPGDKLADERGGYYTFDSATTTAVQGAFHLYNLSFANGPPTYLVSPDGNHWFVAHNIKLQ